MNWDSFAEVQMHVTAWADYQFPKRTAQGTLIKLFEEVGEFARHPHNESEFADLVILLVDLASLNGIDIQRALRDKMRINKQRSWHFNEATGLAHHVEEKK